MKKKIFISIFEIKDIGGISTSVYNFINAITSQCEVDLCVLTNYISPNFKFPAGVNIVPFDPLFNLTYGDKKRIIHQNCMQKIKTVILRAIRKIYGYERTLPLIMNRTKFAKQYDVAIAFWNDAYTSDGKMFWGGDYFNVVNNVIASKKIAWVHNDASQLGFTLENCRKMFKTFDSIVNVSFDCKQIFDNIVPEYEYKSKVVYNFYNIPDILEKSLCEDNSTIYPNNGKLHFVTVCRLAEQQKKVSRIIKTCIKLHNERYTNFDWTIVGDGPDKDRYLEESKTILDAGVIRFVGLKPNPYPYMRKADAFILSSLYEGFGMTIREAQIVGTPTFSTRFGAAEEAIAVGKQGELCDNSTEGLYSMVKGVLDNPQIISHYRNYLKNNPISNDVALKQFYSII